MIASRFLKYTSVEPNNHWSILLRGKFVMSNALLRSRDRQRYRSDEVKTSIIQGTQRASDRIWETIRRTQRQIQLHLESAPIGFDGLHQLHKKIEPRLACPKGVGFANMHCQPPVRGSLRASIMPGLYPYTTSTLENGGTLRARMPIKRNTPEYTTTLKAMRQRLDEGRLRSGDQSWKTWKEKN